MANVGGRFDSEIFRKNFPMVIATNRASAILLPVRLRYQAGGYAAGTVLARNTTDSLYQAYNDAGSSGINTAACVLYEEHEAEDFDAEASTGTTMAVGIFGGCTLYEAKLTGLDAAAKVDLKATSIVDATGVTTLKF